VEEWELDNKSILLVEDNPDDELLALRALKKNNIQSKVVVVRDGLEAVNYLFAKGEYAERDINDTPEVILLDLKLPKLDGIEVLKNIRDNPITCMIPVVMLTSSNEDKDIMNAYKVGVNSFICKPVDFERFLDATKQISAYWLSLNVTPLGVSKQ